MNRILSTFGLVSTVIYLVGVVYLRPESLEAMRTLELNEFGDLLAGVFGPVALLWLILGFFQQGIELRQNREALLAQAEELKAASEQAKALADNSEKQLMLLLEERKRNMEPDLRAEVGEFAKEDDQLRYVVSITNYGDTAYNINASFRPNDEAKDELKQSDDGRSWGGFVDLSGCEFSSSQMGRSYLNKGDTHEIKITFGGKPFNRFSVNIFYTTKAGEERKERFKFKSQDGLRYGQYFGA